MTEKGGGDQSSLMLFQTGSVSEIGIQGGEARIGSEFPIVAYRIWPNCGHTLTHPIDTEMPFEVAKRDRGLRSVSHLPVIAKGWVAV